jgi:tetratricopeptide (TPR) repeat protein
VIANPSILMIALPKQIFYIILCLILSWQSIPFLHAVEEVRYPADSFAKLDTFEALNLEDADKLFHKRDYKGSFAAYKAYSFEFTRSAALPYVLLRMGRCLHMVEKRNAAIKAYQDVVDYFPDDIVYAAAALYYIGECHGQNGDDAKKTATWARMVKDDDYVQQPRSGTALSYLGTTMAKLGKFEEAAQYQWRTAVAFRKTNEQAAKGARSAVLKYYTARNPDHAKLKEFYVEAGGWDGRGTKTENPQADHRYWESAMVTVLSSRVAVEKKESASRYWAGQFGSLFPKNDTLRIRLFALQLNFEKDPVAHSAKLAKQLKSGEMNLTRVAAFAKAIERDAKRQLAFTSEHGGPLVGAAKPQDWMALISSIENSAKAPFFEKHLATQHSRLDRKGKTYFMNELRRYGMHNEAAVVLRGVRTTGMSDKELAGFVGFAAYYVTEEEFLQYVSRMKDKIAASKSRYDYYDARSHRNPPNMEKALTEVPILKKSPEHATVDLTFRQAQLLQGLGRFDESIKAYRSANKQPDSTLGVTDCLVGMKQYANAIKTVKDLEALGGGVASRASLKAADIYKIAGDKGKEVAQLRAVLKRYPKSGESSTAHNRLEAYGVALVGGEAEAEE